MNSGGIGNVYDFENHLVQQGGATIVYDGDGNRVSKTVAGVTTKFLVSDVNPTGYAVVLSETFTGGSGARDLSHTYVYGLDRISQFRSYFTGSQSLTQTSFYVYDGHGSVRALTDPTGNVTDTYDYDAFGNLTHSATTLSSPTVNEFLFAGEQYDSDLHLYYNRARYLNVTTGRFWTMDTYEGNARGPISLQKYLYAGQDPVDALDPTGHEFDLASTLGSFTVYSTITAIAAIGFLWIRGNLTQGDAEQPPSPNATSTNENSIEIYGTHWNADRFFQFMSSFAGVNDGDVGTVTGAPVSGTGQKLTFTLSGITLLGQAPFSVRTKRYDPQLHVIAVVTLQGHPLRGYRYWRVFSPDDLPGHFVVQTGALDEPGPGPLDAIKFVAGQPAQLRIWQEYLQDALRLSGGYEGFDAGYDFPYGAYGVPSKSDVLWQVNGGN